MKNYRITVNGTAYDVAVEEVSGGSAPAAVATPKAAPAPAPAPAPKAQAGGTAGSVVVAAPMPGKILNIKSSVGASVKKGDVILVLEAMKMENEVVTSCFNK